MDAPLIAADVDLRGLEYMPLFGNHLFGSEFNAAASDSEWRAAMTLWWAAWNQVPAGSLPDDDVALCRLADLGRDVKGWRKLKVRALHGFEKCSDGRLYHSFLCDQAVVAWDKRVKERARKAKWREEQEAKKKGLNGAGDGDKHLSPRPENGDQGWDVPDSTRMDVPAEGKGRDVTGRDVKEKKPTASPSASLTNGNGLAKYPPGFETFWEEYPRKVAKDAAVRAYAKRRFSESQRYQVVAAVRLQKEWDQWTREGGQYIPHPATWLNEGRWQDEEPTGFVKNVYEHAI